jgi:hypothetical protein
MPISPFVLQRRHAELGRIRLGDQQPTSNGQTRPAKLSKFRFTSVSEGYIRDLAALYGGEPRAWDNHGISSWEVYSDAQVIPVIAVKGGLSQWMEFWSAGGCIHRCDGETNVLTGDLCDLDEKVQVGRKTVNPHAEAKPTTRLSVMLPELEAIGVWRLETHGWNAAAEIPAVAELAQFVGDLVPANLHLVERRSVKDGQTSRFVVPVLDLQIGTARLKEIVAAKSGTGEITGVTERPAIGAAPAPAAPDYLGELAKAVSVDDCTLIWRTAGQAGHLSDELKAAITAKAAQITAAGFETPGSAPESSSEGVDLGPDAGPDPGSDAGPDADALWVQIVAEAGRLDMDDAALRAELHNVTGVFAEDATGEQLATFLHALTTGEVVGAA